MRLDLFRFSGDHIPHVAIILIRWPDGGTHTGIVYREKDGQLHLIDLQGNRQLSTKLWAGKYAHVIPNVDSDAIENIASLCRVISERNGKLKAGGQQGEILYALKIDAAARFNAATGDLHLKEGIGLTCASFVLIVFLTAGVPLVDLENWPPRESDDVRHDQLVNMLRGGCTPEELAKVQGERPCSRVAPEEVAGAGLSPKLPLYEPLSQTEAGLAGKWLLGALDLNTRFGWKPS